MAAASSNEGLSLRPYQREGVECIMQHPRCLVKYFCGTGKSHVIIDVIARSQKQISVVVFPSLALVSQFATDHLTSRFNGHRRLNISSEVLADVQSSTDPQTIRTFVGQGGPMLILVTYQSYGVLLANVCGGVHIGLVCYDEAHHVTSPEYQTLVFSQTSHADKAVFLTATPRNEHGIVMYDRLNPPSSQCGPLAYEYTYLDGLRDGVLNAFDVCVDMYTDDRCASVYEAIARAILTRGTGRVLTFHAGVNGTSNTSVWNFVDQEAFEVAFTKVQRTEFPEMVGHYVRVTFRGMDGQTSSSDRVDMLRQLDATPDDAVYIISSCETIGEGVDTKRANMCVFADPKSSITKIIQNIGRVVRPNPSCPRSTVLLPCYINMAHYADAQGDAQKQDTVIRAQMRSPSGDYAPILNVLAALRQEDPELYEMCLRCPCDSDSDTDSSCVSSGLCENCSSSDVPSDTDDEDCYSCDSNDSVNSNDGNLGDAEGRNADSLTHCKSNSAKCNLESNDVRKARRIELTTRQNDDVMMLWRVHNAHEFDRKLQSVVIECNVKLGVEMWLQKLADMKAYIDQHQKAPNKRDREVAIKRLGIWTSHQKKNYIQATGIMQNDVIRCEWQATISHPQYTQYLAIDNEAAWKQKLDEVKAYIDQHHKSPSSTDTQVAIKRIGSWIVTQRKNYQKIASIMKNKAIRSEWVATLDDPRYAPHLVIDNEAAWRQRLVEMRAYIDQHHKTPSTKDDDIAIKQLGSWISTQRKNHQKQADIMRIVLIRSEWEATLKDPRYAPYLTSRDEEWWKTLVETKVYIDQHHKAPSSGDTKTSIKRLGLWILNQKHNYENASCIMKNKAIRSEWEATLKDPRYAPHLVIDNEAAWRQRLVEMRAYIDQHQKTPSPTDKQIAFKQLATWISHQKTNYAHNVGSMQNDSIRSEWEATLKDPRYAPHLVIDHEATWMQRLVEMRAYIDEHRKAPSTIDEELSIKRLGAWASNQKQNYEKTAKLMKNHAIRSEWEATLNDPRYAPYLASRDEAWWQTLVEMKAYIDEHRKAPSQHDNDIAIKRLGSWLSTQKTTHEKASGIMQNVAVRIEWEATLADPRYAPHLASRDEVWLRKLGELRAYIETHQKAPSSKDKDIAIKQLGTWISTQKANHEKASHIMQNEAARVAWEATLADPRYAPHLASPDEAWRQKLAEMRAYIDKHQKAPSSIDNEIAIKQLGIWASRQKTNYARKLHIMKNDVIRSEWEATVDDARYGKHLNRPTSSSQNVESIASKRCPTQTPNTHLPSPAPTQLKAKVKKQQAMSQEFVTTQKIPPDSTPCDETPHHLPHRPYPDSSPIGTLHKTYKRMRSDTLHATFRRNPQLWHEYHAERKRNFATYDPSSIPCNRVIQELDKIRTSRRKVVVDMGCGDACIAHHFAAKSDHRFQFHNYDHQSGGDPTITEVDMSNLPLGDASAEIVILSLALWGTRENCEQYIQEAHRVLESGGRFYIIDTTKRWSPEPLTTENAGELLREMLTLRGFGILSEDVGVPFCLFMCNKSY